MQFVKATTQFEFFSLMKVRIDVFVQEQAVSPAIELDEEDRTCDHYIIYDKHRIIATCRIIEHDNTWHIGRVAVLKEHRDKHCGSYMLQQVENLAIQKNVHKLVLGAQLAALPFYTKNGYTPYGDIYLDADIEHRMMEKVL